MTASSRPVWQVSAGPASRSYTDLFLKHGAVAYAKLARLKNPAAELFARMKRP